MSLQTVPPERYKDICRLIDSDSCGAVYAYSVAERIQSGIVYTNENKSILLVWHSCGFALLYGAYDTGILREIGEMMLHPAPFSRMVLFAPDEQAAEYFERNSAFSTAHRLFYRYPEQQLPPELTEAVRITPEILSQIKGKITPAFSWDDTDAFLKKGVGYCVLRDGIPAAWAFSAAVSPQETDIGVETDERYRRQGLAYLAANAMIRYTISHGKKPVWACHAANKGSRKLAEALGFRQCSECITVTGS